MLNQLRVINFGDCLLRSSGAKEIAQAIQEHLPNLEVICCYDVTWCAEVCNY